MELTRILLMGSLMMMLLVSSSTAQIKDSILAMTKETKNFWHPYSVRAWPTAAVQQSHYNQFMFPVHISALLSHQVNTPSITEYLNPNGRLFFGSLNKLFGNRNPVTSDEIPHHISIVYPADPQAPACSTTAGLATPNLLTECPTSYDTSASPEGMITLTNLAAGSVCVFGILALPPNFHVRLICPSGTLGLAGSVTIGSLPTLTPETLVTDGTVVASSTSAAALIKVTSATDRGSVTCAWKAVP